MLVEQCLEFIRELQNTSNEKGEEGLISNDPATPIQDGNLTLTVLALSDLISQLGILPYLQPGVTLPQERRSKSVLKVKPSARIGSVFSSEDSYILANVVSGALDVFWEVKGVLSSILRERLRPDLLCGVTQLAYAPDYPGSQDKFQAAFDEILDE